MKTNIPKLYRKINYINIILGINKLWRTVLVIGGPIHLLNTQKKITFKRDIKKVSYFFLYEYNDVFSVTCQMFDSHVFTRFTYLAYINNFIAALYNGFFTVGDIVFIWLFIILLVEPIQSPIICNMDSIDAIIRIFSWHKSEISIVQG